jgi:hypothetical protein
MPTSEPFNLQIKKLTEMLEQQIFRLTKETDSEGNLNPGPDEKANLLNSPLPMVSPEYEYNVTFDITNTRSMGQGETRYIAGIDSDGYDISIPNHTDLKIVTVNFRAQSDSLYSSSFGVLGNLHSRIRSWESFRNALREIGLGLLKVYPMQTTGVKYNGRITNVSMFDAEFTIPVNDLEIDQTGVIESIELTSKLDLLHTIDINRLGVTDVFQFTGPDVQNVNSIDFNQSGSLLYVMGGHTTSLPGQQFINVFSLQDYDIQTLSFQSRHQVESWLRCFRWASDGLSYSFCSGYPQNQVESWICEFPYDLESSYLDGYYNLIPDLLPIVSLNTPVTADRLNTRGLEFSPDGKRLVISGTFGYLFEYELAVPFLVKDMTLRGYQDLKLQVYGSKVYPPHPSTQETRWISPRELMILDAFNANSFGGFCIIKTQKPYSILGEIQMGSIFKPSQTGVQTGFAYKNNKIWNPLRTSNQLQMIQEIPDTFIIPESE